jgi:TPR repeat protein
LNNRDHQEISMLSDPSKRSHFFKAILFIFLFIFHCAKIEPATILADDSVSNLKRRFVKLYLRAEQGDADAQYAVGMMYYTGQQVPHDSSLAAVWMTKAADQGYREAQYFLSLMYGLGDGVVENNVAASKWCQKAAQQGHADAQYSLARMYSTGQGVQRDDIQAAEWLTRAAEQGHADAQCDLGMMYQSGRGVKRDINQAVRWWVKASEQGHTWSRLLLQDNMTSSSVPAAKKIGNATVNESDRLLDNLEKDLSLLDDSEPAQTVIKTPKATQDRAKETVSIAPEPWSPQDTSIAVIPEKAAGVPLEEKLQSSTPMDASAQYDLAVRYYQGQGDVQDYPKALQLFTVAAEQGHPEAQYKLGVMYSFGQGVVHDPSVAVKWFQLAAKQDLPAAQYCLGVMYSTGQGVPQDLTAAAQWYTRAAEGGSVAAQFMLGLVYSKGQGVVRDSTTAVKWYTRAAEQGSAAAQYVLAVIYEKGQGLMVQDDMKALKWYTRAAEQGHADAQYDLAVKYIEGRGVEKNFVKAYTWCLLAGLNDKDVASLEKWLEARMTAAQLEKARQLARTILEENSQ